MSFLKRSAVLSVALAMMASQPALAEEACIRNLAEVLAQQAHPKDFLRAKLARLEPEAQRAFATLETLAARGTYSALLPEQLLLGLIADEQSLVLVRNLDWLLGRLNGAADLPADPREALMRAARELLGGDDLKVPPSTIDARIQDFLAAPTERSLRRLVGDMEFAEIELLTHGGDPLNPSPDSLIGRYLQETGASSVVRTFSQSENVNGPQGPRRLAIAMSEQTMAAYKKYFLRPEFLIHAHSPQQGTLQFFHNGRIGSYANNGSFLDPLGMNAATTQMRAPSAGAIWPHIVLKTSEGERALQYFRLGSISRQHAKTPWVMDGYCPTGGYSSCTHWFGEIPLGDETVDTYTFPGWYDQWASGPWPAGSGEVMGNPNGRTGPIGSYDPNRVITGPIMATKPDGTPIDVTEKVRTMLARTWTFPRAHVQLADLLGMRTQANRGEFANPGWVAVGLTGSAPVERVPFVFVAVPDARAPLSPTFDTQISAY